jgi:hypothetical protein
MEGTWDAATMLLAYPQLADLLGDRHRIISNDWHAASMSALAGRSLHRSVDLLDHIDFTPAALRADLAGDRMELPRCGEDRRNCPIERMVVARPTVLGCLGDCLQIPFVSQIPFVVLPWNDEIRALHEVRQSAVGLDPLDPPTTGPDPLHHAHTFHSDSWTRRLPEGVLLPREDLVLVHRNLRRRATASCRSGSLPDIARHDFALLPEDLPETGTSSGLENHNSRPGGLLL